MPKIHVSNVRQVLPPVTKADFKGFASREADQRASNWGWTNLKRDICHLMRGHFTRHRAGEWTDFGITGDPKFNLPDKRADDIFGRYGLLNGMHDGKALHTWTDTRDLTVIHGKRPEHPPVDPSFIYIPHVWAVNALAAAEQGIVRITAIATCGFNPTSALHVRIGHNVNGDILEVLSDGSLSGFRYVAPSDWLLALLTLKKLNK